MTWTNLSPSVTGMPRARDSHGFASAGGKLYVHGGSVSGSVANDLHVFDPATKAWTDLSNAVTGTQPKARNCHGFTPAGGKLYLHGGRNYVNPTFGDLYSFDPTTQVWTDLSIAIKGTPPKARECHGFTSAGGKIYVHGGYIADVGYEGRANDLHVYDPVAKAWTDLSVPVAGTPPQKRYIQGITSVGGVLYVHGGNNADSVILKDLHAYSPAEQVWTDLSVAVQSTSPARGLHRLTSAGCKLYLHGGCDNAGNCPANDDALYVFEPANCSWSAAGLAGGLTTTTTAASASDSYADAYSSGPFSVGSSGIQFLKAMVNLMSSAWVIDVAISKTSPQAIVALYIPRTQVGPDGFYTAQFNSTFLSASFPCSAANATARAATTCCLPDFASRYHVAAAFAIADSGGAACTSPFATPPLLIANDSISGGFGSDMPSSWAAVLPPAPGQPDWVSTVRITLGRADLRTRASRIVVQDGASEALDSFVGLAQFVPVPGGRILDSSTSQIALSLVKSDYFTVTASGTTAQTFLSYINVRINEVLDAADPAQRSQYATVSFALNDNFVPNAATGLVPPSSVRVGIGASRTTANWTSSCIRAVSPQFAARLSQPCGPAVAMCTSSPAVGLADRYETCCPAALDQRRLAPDSGDVGQERLASRAQSSVL
jgi:N-acetylneuraminic acid mutarotase